MIVDPEQSLVLYPELRHLVDLRDAGWSFSPRREPDGELRGINGLRMWPARGPVESGTLNRRRS